MRTAPWCSYPVIYKWVYNNNFSSCLENVNKYIAYENQGGQMRYIFCKGDSDSVSLGIATAIDACTDIIFTRWDLCQL